MTPEIKEELKRMMKDVVQEQIHEMNVSAASSNQGSMPKGKSKAMPKNKT